ncbi:hypothetical protein W822_00895 [Advenella kashmirensis W13003]|uniref:Uncharacterized protein n=1 Tax=Advenella kashmirensis W13003 TaxID=1424334 RepID=V8QZ11_9BURK|nr:hypothetical protein W822_00895 [Advenella kashmirensis W13003]
MHLKDFDIRQFFKFIQFPAEPEQIDSSAPDPMNEASSSPYPLDNEESIALAYLLQAPWL